MSFKATFRHPGQMIDHTPVADVSAGDVIVIGGLVCIAHNDIPAGQLGALSVGGVYDVEKDASDVSAGDALYFDADGDPVDGTADSGAFTKTATDNSFSGYALADAGTAATHVRMLLIPTGP
jgi:predicted RecA/RadA family phage recombinase